MGDLTIREMEQGEEFADWFAELLVREEDETGEPVHFEDHYLVLSNEIGDWIGGLRYCLRGGVAQLLDVVVKAEERHHGHGQRLLAAFEERAREAGAHLMEFWTDDTRSEALLGKLDWRTLLKRDNYIGNQTWYLMEKRLG
ncbi:MAG TPA: GNAT family N-acetyltransferase [Gemmatimonadales bacterium]|jgi:ribosomal protein S18 acetylase RimI-like enzyme|nr:GNAT family N-acetyltransferase [Gemmatimonadales bacterium]